MADIELVIKIDEEDYKIMKHNIAINNPLCPLRQDEMVAKVANGIPLETRKEAIKGSMTREKAIDIFDDNFTVIDTHGHYTDEEVEQARQTAIRTLKDYETISQRLGHLPFRMYEGKEMVDKLDIYDTLNNIGYTAIMGE